MSTYTQCTQEYRVQCLTPDGDWLDCQPQLHTHDRDEADRWVAEHYDTAGHAECALRIVVHTTVTAERDCVLVAYYPSGRPGRPVREEGANSRDYGTQRSGPTRNG